MNRHRRAGNPSIGAMLIRSGASEHAFPLPLRMDLSTAPSSPTPAAPADADVVTRGLIARARAGDAPSYDRLFALAAPRLRLYLRVRMGAALRAVAEPEDVLQETWLEAHRALSRFEDRGSGSFTRWLCRIAENVMRGLADRRDARKRTPPGAVAHPELAARWADTATGVATGAVRTEERERVARALESLDDEQRQPLVLRFFAGLTIDEIAALTGDAPTTVRRRLGRATAALGALLEDAP